MKNNKVLLAGLAVLIFGLAFCGGDHSKYADGNDIKLTSNHKHITFVCRDLLNIYKLDQAITKNSHSSDEAHQLLQNIRNNPDDIKCQNLSEKSIILQGMHASNSYLKMLVSGKIEANKFKHLQHTTKDQMEILMGDTEIVDGDSEHGENRSYVKVHDSDDQNHYLYIVNDNAYLESAYMDLLPQQQKDLEQQFTGLQSELKHIDNHNNSEYKHIINELSELYTKLWHKANKYHHKH